MHTWDYNSEMLNSYFNVQPSTVKGDTNIATDYYKRYLWRYIYSRFNFTLPENWKLNFFRFFLFHLGSIAVIYSDEYGWICQPYSINEIDIYYQPKKIKVTTPFINNVIDGTIGNNCEIIKINDDYFGLYDLVNDYAQKLASIDKAVNINVMNSNTAYLFQVENKKEADTVKEAYAQASMGKPFVVVKKGLIDEDVKPMFNNVKNTYIVNDLLQSKRTILNEFLTKIGVHNTNYDKRERLTTSEVNENNDETGALINVMFDNIKASIERVNVISGLQIGVELVERSETDVYEINT